MDAYALEGKSKIDQLNLRDHILFSQEMIKVVLQSCENLREQIPHICDQIFFAGGNREILVTQKSKIFEKQTEIKFVAQDLLQKAENVLSSSD